MPRTSKFQETRRTVETIKHKEASRKNIPTAEYQSVMHAEQQSPIRVAYERRTATSTRNWSGAARTSRTGATW
jgi:adenine-specific DNA-methyltransferase